MTGIELKSPAFVDHDRIPRRYAKEGEDLSPPMTWSHVPEGTAELVLVCEDPDAPSGNFLHWLVTGIDPGTTGVGPGEVPRGGKPLRNGYGGVGWGGPQPPVGDQAHRYVFRLYALPEPLPKGASPDDVRRQAADQQSASGTLVGLYQRRG